MHEFTHTGKAMGTDFSISIVCESAETARALLEGAGDTIHAYEERFSRFLPESELSQLNTARAMTVSPDFLEVLLEAQRLFMLTRGVFNPLVQIERLGYTTSFETLEDAPVPPVANDTYNINFSTTSIDSLTGSVILSEGQRLDFGGFLKGFLAEKIARKIMESENDIQGVIVNLGGDIHTRGVDSGGAPFLFSIYNPITQKDDFHIPLKDTSLATSGTYKRTWMQSGVPTHHILDISGTQNPESNIVSASVIHERGGMTEACAKVFLTLGPERACTLLAGITLRYIIITSNGTVHTDTL